MNHSEKNRYPYLPLAAGFNEKLESLGTIARFKEGEVILNEHAYIRVIPIVKQGCVRVMRTDEDGKEMLLYYIRPGESCIMSLMGALHQEPSRVKAVIEEDAEILLISVDKLPVLTRDYPEWTEYILRLYHKRFEELLDVINAIAFKKLDERILHYLGDKKKMGKSDGIAITHQQLADELGTSRVVVSRLLKQMELQGILQRSRNSITLL